MYVAGSDFLSHYFTQTSNADISDASIGIYASICDQLSTSIQHKDEHEQHKQLLMAFKASYIQLYLQLELSSEGIVEGMDGIMEGYHHHGASTMDGIEGIERERHYVPFAQPTTTQPTAQAPTTPFAPPLVLDLSNHLLTALGGSVETSIILHYLYASVALPIKDWGEHASREIEELNSRLYLNTTTSPDHTQLQPTTLSDCVSSISSRYLTSSPPMSSVRFVSFLASHSSSSQLSSPLLSLLLSTEPVRRRDYVAYVASRGAVDGGAQGGGKWTGKAERTTLSYLMLGDAMGGLDRDGEEGRGVNKVREGKRRSS